MNKLRVVLVDDEVTILEGFKKLFNWDKYGCEVVGEAMDGAIALNMADALAPDLMIVDINIPIISGLEVVKILHEKYPEMQFIIVSGYDDFEYCREALRLKIVDYVLKPVDFSEFGRIINRSTAEIYRHKTIETVESNEATATDDVAVTLRMIAFMKENLSETISLQSLSEEFHLNSSYISQMFKVKTGMNYYNYLEQLRMNKANQLLASTSKSITEIANCVGYQSYRVFTKVYKKNQGILPSQYRKLN